VTRLPAALRSLPASGLAWGWTLAVLALVLPPALPAARAQEAALNVTTVQSLLSRGDAAAAAGNSAEARRLYDQAREASRRLVDFYRDLSGAFRGLDARIPREMDDKGRMALDKLAQSNLRLAALFRRQNQPEVAVPLLVEVVKTMTPANEFGRKAYQELLEIGFATTPYTYPGSAASP
jgi:hypothetical protein